MGEIYDPAVKFTLGSFLLLLLLIVVSPSQGLQCYHCTSDDPGCNSSVNATQNYVRDCPGAYYCITFQLRYEYVFPRTFFRTCLYDQDRTCYDALNGLDWYFSPRTNNRQKKYAYPAILACLKKSRSEANISAPILEAKPELPADEYALLVYVINSTELGNSVDRSELELAGLSDTLPSIKNFSCYSCEAETPGDRFGERSSYYKIYPRLPYCGSMGNDKMPVVQCKGAYGCAVFWEVRNEMEKGQIKTFSRVWRDCWYPGEQKCLRYPGPSGRRSPPYYPNKSEKETQTSCGRSYENGFPVKWTNIQKIQTWTKYNEYVQCTQDIRTERGSSAAFLKLVKEESDKKDGNPFAQIEFYYCGPRDKCNSGDPYRPPPTDKPMEPFDPDLPETSQPGCSKTDEGNAASSYHGTSKVVLLLASFIFTLLQN